MKKKVLSIEDERALAEALRQTVEAAGFQPGVAENGRVGVELAVKANYSVIIMDTTMPVMDGFEALRTLRTTGINTLVIALSSLSLDEDISKVMQLGAKRYFVKSDTQLVEIIHAVKEVCI